MPKRDYYEVLGVDRNAAKDDIKRAYRRIAVANHPDRNPNDHEAEKRFKEATEAYEILADAKRRQAYDRYGFAGVEGMGGAGAHDSSIFRGFEDIFGGDLGGFSGIFESLFGGGRQQQSQRRGYRGADLRYELIIPLEAAVYGTQEEVMYDRRARCPACKGDGREPGTGKTVCNTCGGRGQVRRSSGFFSIAQTCPECGGSGEVVEHPCRQCGGNGLLQKRQRIKVKIQAGTESGRTLRISGQGHAGTNGGPDGDLYVVIGIRPHRFFERHGNDLYCRVSISMTQAALGAEITISTLDARRIKIKVPAGTQNGRLLRIGGEGVPYRSSRKGDLHVELLIAVPGRLSAQMRSLLRQIAALEDRNDSPELLPLGKERTSW